MEKNFLFWNKVPSVYFFLSSSKVYFKLISAAKKLPQSPEPQ